MNELNPIVTGFIDVSIILVLIVGIWQFRTPRQARSGNLTAACALLCASILVLYRNGIIDADIVIISLIAGAVIGYGVARAVTMIQIPAMVAFQHGMGGIAAFLISLVELTRATHTLDRVSEISGILGLTIGSLTFSGSMIAGAKLSNTIRQTPHILPAHSVLVITNIVALVAVGSLSLYVPDDMIWYILGFQIILAAVFGILFSIRIGGADMPVVISFLNATAGLAASFCGMVTENRLLIAFGATVAASGSILTHVMCNAMNRSLIRIFFPPFKKQTGSSKLTISQSEAAPTRMTGADDRLPTAVDLLTSAQNIVVIPGYGMALSQAQMDVVALADKLISMGKDVRYAIHPVAGRMPGHMNVLLAEAGVEYDMLVEMEAINPEFPSTDLVLVVGACDVVNPSAIHVDGTPISGMPILMAHEAKHVVCCNFDDKPGYSGVTNSLYEQPNTILLTGDAKKTVCRLLSGLDHGRQETADVDDSIAVNLTDDAGAALVSAKNVIIIPGYGMALAKAQFKIVELACLLREKGARVKYAIHPVAGRMPGHMNVILAEAEVDYDDLLEMDEVNPIFSETDVALVVGACDVFNPAAIQQEGTPISGMPILNAHESKQIIICNYDRKPGYSGVENPLYDHEKTIFLPGDAKETADRLIASIRSF